MTVQLPDIPVTLRPIQHYLKTALEHDGRDPVISYWCRIYALQTGLKIDKKSDSAKIFLMSLMDWLEKEKKALADNEAITNDIAAQAHVENYALKLFLWADGQDRQGQFNKNVVKSFYTAGFLMDVLNTFGEQTEEIHQNCKYAKWKAAYIHNCLRNNIPPVPGPAGGNEQGGASDSLSSQPNIGFEDLNHRDSISNNPPSNIQFPSIPKVPSTDNYPTPPSNQHSFTKPPSLPTLSPISSSASSSYNPAEDSIYNPTINGTGVKLQPDQISKAQKYCKWAGSALNYDDVPEAIINLQKALKLLTTGDDS